MNYRMYDENTLGKSALFSNFDFRKFQHFFFMLQRLPVVWGFLLQMKQKLSTEDGGAFLLGVFSEDCRGK